MYLLLFEWVTTLLARRKKFIRSWADLLHCWIKVPNYNRAIRRNTCENYKNDTNPPSDDFLFIPFWFQYFLHDKFWKHQCWHTWSYATDETDRKSKTWTQSERWSFKDVEKHVQISWEESEFLWVFLAMLKLNFRGLLACSHHNFLHVPLLMISALNLSELSPWRISSTKKHPNRIAQKMKQ